MIYNACQMGIRVDINDLALHTLMSVTEYASKILKKEDDIPVMNAREFRKS